VFEIAAHGRPAVLIPYPHATADHQTTNARYMERAGAALVIPDRELTGPRLAQEVGHLLADPARLAAMGRAAAAASSRRELIDLLWRVRRSSRLSGLEMEVRRRRFRAGSPTLTSEGHQRYLPCTDGGRRDWAHVY
jgi:hypothetical protein